MASWSLLTSQARALLRIAQWRARSGTASQSAWASPSAAQITPASAFYWAEEHHQRYLEKHGHPGCAATTR